MGTEDEQQLTLKGRAAAAAGAAFVAAAIVNPLDVIKTRIQAQAMAVSTPGQPNCTAPNIKCTSTLYEHAARRALHHCPTEQQQQLQRYSHLLRHSHTMTPEAAAWLRSMAVSSAAAVSAAAASAADSAVAVSAGAAAAFRRWGITEGPVTVRRTPAYPPGWTPTPAGAGAAAAGAGMRAGGLHACECAAAPLPVHSMWETAKSITAREGLPVLWRGTSASLLIAVPMVGIYMPLYDALLAEWNGQLGSIAPVAAGTAARTAACFCVAPFELLRTRLQASAGSGVSIRSTIANFLLDHHHHDSSSQKQQQQQQQHQQRMGLSVLQQQQQVQQQAMQVQPQRQVGPALVLRSVPRMWTGFSATLVRDVPFSALYWALVEPLRQAMLPVNSHWSPWAQRQQRRQQQASSAELSGCSGGVAPHPRHVVHHTQMEILVANMVSGFVAGGVSAGLTTPFDVVKTRMQIAQPGSSGSASSASSTGGVRVFNILKDVYRTNGVEGLFSGLKPRAYRAAPACAIVISVYELLKSWLTPQEAAALARAV